jgi:hypothetical protein
MLEKMLIPSSPLQIVGESVMVLIGMVWLEKSIREEAVVDTAIIAFLAGALCICIIIGIARLLSKSGVQTRTQGIEK